MKRRFLYGTAVFMMLVLAAAGVDLPPGSKIVFLKGKELVRANADGSRQMVLTHDGVTKGPPRWSPDGMKIAYSIPSNSPKALAVIKVITGDGEPVNDIPVWAEMPDGTLVEGIRSVDDSGWFDGSSIYVEGTENPHYGEYRVFDVASAKMTAVYGGYGFTTCPSQGKVAYVADPDNDSPAELHVQVNGTMLVTVPANQEPRYFQWSADCERLAYLAGNQDRTRLVIVRNRLVEAVVRVGAGFAGASITTAGNGFALEEAGQRRYYDVVRKTLSDAQAFAAGATNKPQVAAEGLAERLGGGAASVWIPKE